MKGNVIEFPRSKRPTRAPALPVRSSDAKKLERIVSSALALESVYVLIDEGDFESARTTLAGVHCSELEKTRMAVAGWLNEMQFST